MFNFLNVKKNIKNFYYDFGIIGVWYGLNYGSVLTYYALYKLLQDMGYKVALIDKPLVNIKDPELRDSHSRRFAKEYFNILDSIPLRSYSLYNKICKTFIIGSDQVWNRGVNKFCGYAFYMDFVDDEHKKNYH